MEKKYKKIRALALLLIVILMSIIAFGGIFIKRGNSFKNVLPKFKLGKDFDGIRELKYIVDTSEEEKNVYVDSDGNIMGEVKEDNSTNVSLETESGEEISNENNADNSEYKTEKRLIKANEDNVLTIENYEKTKRIIQKRLESRSNYDYNIRLDSLTGEIIVEVPNNDEVETIESLIQAVGKIEVIDYQNGLKLIDDSEIKSASVLSSNKTDYRAYLQLQFDKEGTVKLKNISNNYKTITSEDGKETTKYISIVLDGQTILTTYFGEEVSDGIIQIPLGESTIEYKEYLETLESAKQLELIINNENMPVVYKLSSDNFIKSNIDNNIELAKIIIVIAILIISLYIIIKYKINGLKISILSIGYIAFLLLTMLFTNVYITLNSVMALLLIIIINYTFMIKVLNNLEKSNSVKNSILKSMKETYLSIIPVIVIAFVFTFMGSISISSIGMVFFWGILIHVIYNFIFTLFVL